MNMKRKYIRVMITLLLGMCLLNQGCSKYNTPEPLEFKELKPNIGSAEYYEALRAYKKSDHAIAFGWWGGSAPPAVTSEMGTRYLSLPDSMDIVSLWGGFPAKDAWDEMQYVRRVKGTRFVMCMFASQVEALMRKTDSTLAKNDLMAAIDKVAKAIADTIDKYQIDGFDLDYEPEYGDVSIFGDEGGPRNRTYTDDAHTERLFLALSKYIGPKSGTGKVLMIDGQFDRRIEPYIDYLAQQAYNSTTVTSLQTRFTNYGAGILPSKKFIVTENMQQYGASGVAFTYNGVNVGSVLGMAYWNPTQGRKGGFGGYIIERDALSNPSVGYYYYLRRGIQVQNPAPY